MEKRVDVAIIGAGTAGLSALAEVKKVTQNFVIIDPGPLGTTCARVGCMPSKVLIQVANDFHRRFSLAQEGIRGGENLEINRSEVLKYVRSLRDRFTANVLTTIEKNRDQFINEHAEFIEPTVLKAGVHRIYANKVIIASGSRPIMSPNWLEFGDRVITTDNFFELEDLPNRVSVIGMGVIGAELGQAMHRLGVEVSGFGVGPAIASLSDPVVQEAAIDILSQEFPLYLTGKANVFQSGDHLVVRSEGSEVEVDAVLGAIGRRPNLEELGLEKLGIILNERGLPSFDPTTMQIERMPLFIAGDVNEDRALLHEASDEGRIAGYNSVREGRCFKRRSRLNIAFTDPNIAVVGQSFMELQERNIAIGEVRFERQGRAVIKQENKGILRIYGDVESGIILGAEMIAPDGEHMAHLLAWAIQRESKVIDLLQLPFYHPSVHEGLRTALRDLLRNMEGPKPSFEIALCESVSIGMD